MEDERGVLIDDDEDGSFYIDGRWSRHPQEMDEAFPALAPGERDAAGAAVSPRPLNFGEQHLGGPAAAPASEHGASARGGGGWKSVGALLSQSTGGGFHRSAALESGRARKGGGATVPSSKHVQLCLVTVSWPDCQEESEAGAYVGGGRHVQGGGGGDDDEEEKGGVLGQALFDACPFLVTAPPRKANGIVAGTLQVRVPVGAKHVAATEHDLGALIDWYKQLVMTEGGPKHEAVLDFPAWLSKEARAQVHRKR
jgi:hypothetical protein